MVGTKTLYNDLWAGRSSLSPFELPDALKQSRIKRKRRINKRPKGTSIEQHPSTVDARIEMGHWEADTVIGLRNRKNAVIFTLVERVTSNNIAFRIPSKTNEAIQDAMQMLHAAYGEHFSDVFKSITTDNGTEFEAFLRLNSGE